MLLRLAAVLPAIPLPVVIIPVRAGAQGPAAETALGLAASPSARAWRGGAGFLASQVLALEAALAGLDRQVMEQLMTRQAGDGGPAQPTLQEKAGPWGPPCPCVLSASPERYTACGPQSALFEEAVTRSS